MRFLLDDKVYLGTKNAILFNSSATHLEHLALELDLSSPVVLGEMVLVNGRSSLCLPYYDAKTISAAMLKDERLHTCKFMYRKSGPQKGNVWAQPTLLREHTAAKKRAAAAARLPKPEADILKCQVIIEVLGLDAHNHGNLVEPLMEHINAVTNF